MGTCSTKNSGDSLLDNAPPPSSLKQSDLSESSLHQTKSQKINESQFWQLEKIGNTLTLVEKID